MPDGDGFTPADLVFPMFMFLMGILPTFPCVSIAFNVGWRLKIVKRAFLLIFIGVAMSCLLQQ